eukprot:Clim_evm46s253 gene=Clim_evmTU46s253
MLGSGPHKKCRNTSYKGSENSVDRTPVPDDKTSWQLSWPDYKPVEFTDPKVLAGPVWADPVDPKGIKYNTLDSNTGINRLSHGGTYEVHQTTGAPLNPQGRTGICGRGLLGRWGPNHAADPIVTRWKRDENREKIFGSDGNPILQFVAIQRKDTGEWAIPGGMVEAGDTVSATLKKEFGEEALNSLEWDEERKTKLCAKVEEILSDGRGERIFAGYVDDPRNTDNAWMETVAVNFHDEVGAAFDQITLHAGDDAGQVKWVDIRADIALYASHANFIRAVAKLRHASENAQS